MKHPVTIFTFGRFSICCDGQEIPPPQRHGDLLCQLLLCQPNRRAEASWLAEQLWPLSEGDQAIQYLYAAAVSFRTATASDLLVRQRQAQSYQLAGQDRLWVDADAALSLLSEAEALGRTPAEALPLFEQAMQYFRRGRYLAGVEETWVQARRMYLEMMKERALLRLAEMYGQQGQHIQAHTLLSEALAEDPTNENLLCRLMQILHEAGMTHQALRAYQTFVKALRRTGLEPAEATTDLYERLKRAPLLLTLPQASQSPAQQAERGTLPTAVEEAEGNSALVSEALPVQQIESAFSSDSHDPSSEDMNLSLSSADQGKIRTAPLWNVPHHRNPFFTGREDVLAHLHDILQGKTHGSGIAPLALCGLGGIGKTQCVLEYAYRYAHEYQAVFWIKADTRENLLADFLTIASLLHLPEQSAEDRAVTVAAVQRWFQFQERWLLILDNVEDLTLMREFLPPGRRGHVLFTTRMQALGGLACSVPVAEMDQETGALFLLRRAGLCPPDTSRFDTTTADTRLAQALVQELGGLPLALDQAGAYIEETASDLQTYLDGYHSSRQALLERRGGVTTDHPESVATTWTLAFTRIESSDSVAADLLHLCAFLDPDAIPEELLFAGLQDLTGSSGEVDPLRFNEAVGVLLRFSLARRHGKTHTLTLHRLVQAMIEGMMNPSQHIQYATSVIQALLSLFLHTIEVDNWPQCQRLLPHVHVLVAHSEWYSHAYAEVATLCNQAGYYLREQALYQEAEALYQKGLALREHCFGAFHPDTAQICYNLGRLYFDMGQYTLSIQFHQRALAIREQVLAPDDFHIARSLNSLAFAYYIQDIATEEIEPLFLRALSIYEQAIGRDHPITSHCLSNLALFYASQDRFLEAERLLLEVQAIRERHLPPLHLDTARSLQNLAWLYIYQKKRDRYKEAKKLLERSLAIRSTLLGAFHPQVAISLHHLAWLLEAENNYTEAQQLYQQILDIRQRCLGPASPKVALTRKHYAALLRKMGREEEATALEAHEPTLSAQ